VQEAPLTVSSPPSHPREQLLAGMIEVASASGYAGASVARVIERAGTSRRTFYSHFSGREECFVEAYRSVVARALEATVDVVRKVPSKEQPRAILATLLEGVASDPPAARLALFEVYAAPPAVRAQHERLVWQLEAELERCLRCGWPEGEAPQLPVRALRAAIEDVVSNRLLREEAEALPSLADDLFAWVEAYRPPPRTEPLHQGRWDRMAESFPLHFKVSEPAEGLLPRGRSALPPELAASERRARIIGATIRATAAKGYSAVTVADIAAAARVTKAAFYSQFGSKQEAFLAAQRRGLEESLAAAAAAFYGESEWLDRVWAGLRALLRYLAENPEAAVLGVREVHAAGEEAIRLQHDIRNAFTLFLEGGHRQRINIGKPLPSISPEALAGANHGLIRRQILSRGAEGTPGLLPQLVYVTVTPFVGHEEAMAFIVEKVEAGSRGAREAASAWPGRASPGRTGLAVDPG